jgi:hypothetical protein
MVDALGIEIEASLSGGREEIHCKYSSKQPYSMKNSNQESEPNVVEVVQECARGKRFTAETFLEYLRPSNDRWQASIDYGGGRSFGTLDKTPWLFRGESDVSWELKPSLWRPGNEQILKLVRRQQKDHSIPERYKAFEEVYKQLREEFKLLADRVGLLPFLQVSAEEGNSSVFDQKTPLDALAQHHGIPTHLLDWTFNSLTAAFFAAEKQMNTNLCVYAFNIRRLPSNIQTNILGNIPQPEVPPSDFSFSPYLRSQFGVFIHLAKTQDYFTKHGEWPDLVTALKLWSEEQPASFKLPVLQKIVLSACERPKLLELLRREFITRAHLMPTLDNVGQQVMADADRIISSN